MRMVLSLYSLSPQTHYFDLMIKKIRKIPTQGHPTKYLISIGHDISKVIQNKGSLRDCHSRAMSKEITMIKCNVLSWMESWRRKKGSGEKLWESESSKDIS